jgi:hypothetical protein
VEAGAYLLGYLQELDFCQQNGMGTAPLSFQELQAWQSSTGLALSSWETLALRQLSRDYIDQLARSRDPSEPAPYQTEDLPRQREAVHNFFKQLARRRKRNDGHRKSRRKGNL